MNIIDNRQTREKTEAELQERAANEIAAAQRRKIEFERRAAQLGLSSHIYSPDGNSYAATLIAITADGRPLYASPHNIAAADTIGVDQVWEEGLVTALPNWPTGGSRFILGQTAISLGGNGVTVGIWEAEEAPGFASVLTTHNQLVGRAAQQDSAIFGLSQHATAVAKTVGSAGLDAFYLLNGRAYNWGNHSRGTAHEVALHAYNLATLTDEMLNEADYKKGITVGGMRLSNHSYGLNCGWRPVGSQWYWYGTGSALQDWMFGSYLGDSAGMSPMELDRLANIAKCFLMIYSAGNDQNQGPGSLPAGGYWMWNGSQWVGGQTATRDWNDGDAGGYDTLPPSACAKNVLTVGAVYDLVDGHLGGNITLAPFSSFGPTDDGRIKPDVVACGIRTGTGARNPDGLPGLLSLYCDPGDPSSTDYYAYGLTGTSFSAPAVAGGLATVLQLRRQLQPYWDTDDFLWKIRSSTLRGLAIHNAREAGDFPGPDFRFGYGLFDAAATVNLVGVDASAPSTASGHPRPFVKEVQLLSGVPKNYAQFNIRAVSSDTPLKVTICWIDPEGDAQTTDVVDEQTVRLCNDIDLRIYPPGTQVFNPNAASTFKPWVLNPDLIGQNPNNRDDAAGRGDDTRNNVEQVVVNNPTTTGDYIVRVTHKGILSGGEQWVSIIISGSTIREVPAFLLTPAHQGEGWVTFSWPAVVGGVYQIVGSSSLFGPWEDASGHVSANRESMSFSAYAPAPNYFWRGIRYY